jgi:hypothetical protein
MPTASGSKRGKKLAIAVATVAVEEPVAEQNVIETPVPVPSPAKKKQKKPIKIVAVVTPDGIEGSFMPEPRRPLIAHLQVRSNEINFSSTCDDKADPEPYNPSTSDVFALDQEIVQSTNNTYELSTTTKKKDDILYASTEQKKDVTSAVESRPLQCYAKVKLMVQYEDGSKGKNLPDQTEIACFWCAHQFEGQPCIIPEREVAGTYNVYGNFCCPECALAYCLNETIDPHVRWERIALLHRIYDREGRGRMFPSPPRECLKLFGGPLSIESYRATVRQGKVRIDLHMPPMVSILGSIDTKPIDFFDSSIKNTLVGGLQTSATTKAEEGLRLKRSKPLKDRDSTLDSVMNINIRSTNRR